MPDGGEEKRWQGLPLIGRFNKVFSCGDFNDGSGVYGDEPRYLRDGFNRFHDRDAKLVQVQAPNAPLRGDLLWERWRLQQLRYNRSRDLPTAIKCQCFPLVHLNTLANPASNQLPKKKNIENKINHQITCPIWHSLKTLGFSAGRKLNRQIPLTPLVGVAELRAVDNR